MPTNDSSLPYREFYPLGLTLISTYMLWGKYKDQIQHWSGPVINIFTTALNLYFARHQEERKRRDDKINRIHELQTHAATAASGKKVDGQVIRTVSPDYILAHDLYSESRLLLESVYGNNMNCETAALYFHICTEIAMMGYRLNRYQQADQEAGSALNKIKDFPVVPCQKIKTRLFNLRGLINYIQSNLELDLAVKKQLEDKAIDFFQQSYAIDGNQCDVDVYLRYLKHSESDAAVAFFSNSIPLKLSDDSTPLVSLNFDPESVLYDHLFFLYAEGCFRERAFIFTEKLYDHIMTNTVFCLDPSSLFNYFLVRLRYIAVCKELCKLNTANSAESILFSESAVRAFQQALFYLNNQKPTSEVLKKYHDSSLRSLLSSVEFLPEDMQKAQVTTTLESHARRLNYSAAHGTQTETPRLTIARAATADVSPTQANQSGSSEPDKYFTKRNIMIFGGGAAGLYVLQRAFSCR